MSDSTTDSKTVNLESIQRLFQQAKAFPTMEAPQKAAYRATLKRFLGRVKDDKIKAALQRLAEYVGESKPPYRGVNATDITTEYQTKYSGYDTKQKGAFKAKLTRLMNSLREAGDEAAARRLAGIQFVIREEEEREIRESILDLAALLPDVTEEE